MASGCSVNIMKVYGIDMNKLYIMLMVSVLSACATSEKIVKTPAVNGVPEWFAAEPEKDNKSIIVTATDTSRDMQFAIDKAMMNARVEMASRINVKIESLVKESLLEDGYGKMKDVDREIERVSKQVTNQHLSMYTREKLFIAKEDDGYRAFVMLKINVDQSRRLVDNVRKTDRRSQFKELEDSVNNR